MTELSASSPNLTHTYFCTYESYDEAFRKKEEMGATWYQQPQRTTIMDLPADHYQPD